MVRHVTITSKMNHEEIRDASFVLLDIKKKCLKCDGINTMWIKDICFNCTLELLKCVDCGKKCHYDLGGIYDKCKTCIGTDMSSDVPDNAEK